MKNQVYLLISLLLITCNGLFNSNSASGKNPEKIDSLRVLATPELYNLSVKWAVEYNRIFPGVKIGVKNVTDQKMAADLIKAGSIGFVSDDFCNGLPNESLWQEVVARDVIVPIINSKNPFVDEISQHGISPAVLSGFLKNEDTRNWGEILRNGKNARAEYYCLKDEPVLKILSSFLKEDEVTIQGKHSGNAMEVISAVQKEPCAIGFCKLINIIDFKNQTMVDNIRLLPIDRNGNGQIDSNEKIYDDINNFSRGVWIGKYPKSLFSNIYTVTREQPENETEIAFLKWVLSDGQNFISASGYSELLVSERVSATDKLYNARIFAGASANEHNIFKSLLFIIATVILIGLIVGSVSRQRELKKSAVKITDPVNHPRLNQDSLKLPKGIYYDKTHTWAFLETNGIVKVGIDDFLQHLTGKITRIKMKSPGKKVKKGDQILSIIQNGKQLNLYAPVSGTIIEQNTALETNSYSLNTSPYNDGWVYKIEPSNWNRESQLLFMADKQREFIKQEILKLKDFLMTSLGPDPKYAQVMLQDGGEISDGVLSLMGPEIWEDFQTNFIDPSRQVWFYEMF